MDANKVKEIFSDKAFAKSLLELESATQVQAELKKKGLDFSENDIMKIRDEISKNLENGTKPEELSLDQLDDVAGGIAITTTLAIVGGVLAAVVFADEHGRGRGWWGRW